jgi:hypothetical protein
VKTESRDFVGLYGEMDSALKNEEKGITATPAGKTYYESENQFII